MRFRDSLLISTLLLAGLACAAQEAATPEVRTTTPSLQGKANGNDVLVQEIPNFKSDLQELRAMLNVLASQESGADMRTAAALQTNRKMWQVVIYRMAELTQRLEELEQKQGVKAQQK